MADGNRNDVSGGIDADRPKLLPQLRRSFTTRVAGGIEAGLRPNDTNHVEGGKEANLAPAAPADRADRPKLQSALRRSFTTIGWINSVPDFRSGPPEGAEQERVDSVQHHDFSVYGGVHEEKSDANAEFHELKMQGNVIKTGMLKKRVESKSMFWSERYVTLTSTSIYIANDVGGAIRDEILLLDIAQIERVVESAEITEETNDEVAFANSMKRKSTMQEAEFANVFRVLHARFGRTYYLQANSSAECLQWLLAIMDARDQSNEAYQRSLNFTRQQRFRRQVARAYDAKTTQIGIAVIIFLNFIINIAETEVEVHTDAENICTTCEAFNYVNDILTAVYVIELLVNLYGHWPSSQEPFFAQPSFFTDPWCLFDFAVVLMSVTEIILVELNANFNVLRSLRIVRVLRLVNKFKAFSGIMNALSASLKPVASALALFSIVISVYAILGERLFRGPHGLEYYGTFSLSFVTLIGVATGDSWTAEIHKMYPAENSWMAVTAFHLSFSIAVGILAMNVIVSVLVDAFMSTMLAEEEQHRVALESEEQKRTAGALDPLLATLSHFHSPAHLRAQTQVLFRLWDVDDSGFVDFEEMKLGVAKMGYEDMNLSAEDWDALTHHGELCGSPGPAGVHGMDLPSFERAMWLQLSQYSQRLLASKMAQSIRSQSETVPILLAMKVVMMEVLKRNYDQSTHGHASQGLGEQDRQRDSVAGGERDEELGAGAELPRAELGPSSSSNITAALPVLQQKVRCARTLVEEQSRAEDDVDVRSAADEQIWRSEMLQALAQVRNEQETMREEQRKEWERWRQDWELERQERMAETSRDHEDRKSELSRELWAVFDRALRKADPNGHKLVETEERVNQRAPERRHQQTQTDDTATEERVLVGHEAGERKMDHDVDEALLDRLAKAVVAKLREDPKADAVAELGREGNAPARPVDGLWDMRLNPANDQRPASCEYPASGGLTKSIPVVTQDPRHARSDAVWGGRGGAGVVESGIRRRPDTSGQEWDPVHDGNGRSPSKTLQQILELSSIPAPVKTGFAV